MVFDIKCPNNNELTSVDSQMFKEMFNDRLQFSLNSCVKYFFPKDSIFLNHSGLDSLSIINANLSEIYIQTFSELRNLTKLILTNNNIKSLNKNIFNNNIHLNSFIIDRNSLYNIDVDIFKNLKNFTKFTMNFNTQYDFPNNKPFLQSESLKIYSCTNCSITHIDTETFSSLISLREIILNKNKISFIKEHAFPESVTLLNIEENQLAKFHPDLIHQNFLKLQLDGNNFESCLENNKLVELYNKKKFRENILTNKSLQPFEKVYLHFVPMSTPKHTEALTTSTTKATTISITLMENVTTTSITTIATTTSKSTTNISTTTSKSTTVIDLDPKDEVIQAAFISTYLVIMSVAQIIIVSLLYLWNIKLNRRKEVDFDESITILNTSRIYKIE